MELTSLLSGLGLTGVSFHPGQSCGHCAFAGLAVEVFRGAAVAMV